MPQKGVAQKSHREVIGALVAIRFSQLPQLVWPGGGPSESIDQAFSAPTTAGSGIGTVQVHPNGLPMVLNDSLNHGTGPKPGQTRWDKVERILCFHSRWLQDWPPLGLESKGIQCKSLELREWGGWVYTNDSLSIYLISLFQLRF